jgi:hypothetical protein
VLKNGEGYGDPSHRAAIIQQLQLRLVP